MARKRIRYWRREGEVTSDGLICPECGNIGKILLCECGKGLCFEWSDLQGEASLRWRRSPCPKAHCLQCGWRGRLKHRGFEDAYGLAKCRVSRSGWHDARATIIQNEAPAPITVELVCIECGQRGHFNLDVVQGVHWESQE